MKTSVQAASCLRGSDSFQILLRKKSPNLSATTEISCGVFCRITYRCVFIERERALWEFLFVPCEYPEAELLPETSAIGEQYFRLADEKAGNNLLYRIVTNMKPELSEPEREGHKLTSPDNLFRFQSSVIRKLAATENCIIVGRCGNYVLQDQLDDVIRIFVYADTVTRVRRIMEVDQVDEAEALRRMKQIDKTRTEYHRYYTGREWMDMESYDLPINASRIDYDQMIHLIKDYMKLRGYLE